MSEHSASPSLLPVTKIRHSIVCTHTWVQTLRVLRYIISLQYHTVSKQTGTYLP